MTREEAKQILDDICVTICEGRGNGKSHQQMQYVKALGIASSALCTARWKRFHIYNYGTFFECDNCGFEASDKFYYCPNCGAKMEGVYREQ